MADKEKPTPHVTDAGGIRVAWVLGADGRQYMWSGSGSVTVTQTTVKEEYYEGEELKTRPHDTEYVTIILATNPTLPQAQLPVRAAKPAKTSEDAWNH